MILPPCKSHATVQLDKYTAYKEAINIEGKNSFKTEISQDIMLTPSAPKK